ncbi:competence protein ComEC [Limimonas halophila]|uniref:Competence protein ComEC n=1 Tax=Limimonas halophila TaxID=1082479 RepID=A0A1G7N9R9_9PROT|nr:ComEC/Rec2 family competence protein [Limimonas halophila]SDF70825.1 competence protein ComEC [Limimonas halophila]
MWQDAAVETGVRLRSRAAIRLRALLARAHADVLADRPRWVLWLPVALGAGVALYFALPVEPPWWAGGSALLLAAWVAVSGRSASTAVLPAVLMVAAASGFTAAQLRTHAVAAPVLSEETGPTAVSGRVIAREPHDSAVRLTLANPAVDELAPDRTPARVRVTVRHGGDAVLPGERVRMKAVLHPPPSPPLPSAFDFPRRAYFDRLGAVGYALGRPDVLDPGAGGGWLTSAERLRDRVVSRVREAAPGPAGGVAAALMTGKRGAIPEPVRQDLRDAGLAHLLAISGLHVGLVAGLVFFLVRLAGAAVPPVALRVPLKTTAAVSAATAAAGYLALTGFTVPTVRAFVMAALVLVAVALNRRAITMRVAAVAASGLLLVHPESLVGVSFQLSFAATVSLIACYETLRDRRPAGMAGDSVPAKVIAYLGGVVLTTIVATLATAPFTVAHFNRLAIYGVVANLAAVPLAAFWIMPLALGAFALMPFGAEGLALTPMTWGIEAVLAVAERIAGWPHAVVHLPTPPTWGFVLTVAGGLWLCLWTARWRRLGLVPIVLGAASLLHTAPPDVLVGRDGYVMAVRGSAGRLWLSEHDADSYTTEVWLHSAGLTKARALPSGGNRDPVARVRCDPLGCIQRRPGGAVVALVRDQRALRTDCARATVLVSTEPVPDKQCRHPRIVIDRFDLWREGAHVVRFTDGTAEVTSVRGARGRRPWVRWPNRE